MGWDWEEEDQEEDVSVSCVGLDAEEGCETDRRCVTVRVRATRQGGDKVH